MAKQRRPADQAVDPILAADPGKRLDGIVRRHRGTPAPTIDPHAMHLPAPSRGVHPDQLSIFDD